VGLSGQHAFADRAVVGLPKNERCKSLVTASICGAEVRLTSKSAMGPDGKRVRYCEVTRKVSQADSLKCPEECLVNSSAKVRSFVGNVSGRTASGAEWAYKMNFCRFVHSLGFPLVADSLAQENDPYLAAIRLGVLEASEEVPMTVAAPPAPARGKESGKQRPSGNSSY
jgi:hypothetical protein